MKKIILFFLISAGLFVFASCAKDGLNPASLPITEPHIATSVAPKIRIVSNSKVYIPLEFEQPPILSEIYGDLPVIALYPYNLDAFSAENGWNLSYWDYWNNFEVFPDEFTEISEYILYGENFEVIYSGENFTPPTSSEVGEYLLSINRQFYIKLVIVEPRVPYCGNLDDYHGGSYGLLLREGYDELLELEKRVPFACTTDEWTSCPCFLQTETDVQNLYSWLRLNELRLPFSDTAAFREISVRARYGDIYVRYELDDMVFTFNIHPHGSWTVDTVEGWRSNGFVETYTERVTTVDDVNIYRVTYPDYGKPSVSYSLSVNGAPVGLNISIPCKIPDTCDRGADYGGGHVCDGEWVDRQEAFEGLMQFRFETLQ
ncbi:MAG: hypothetical protein FWG70_09435 [Oscillospiraceae bacterium]|nr:hypothetical protein [Oscillospiraceae bacterium]